MKSNLKRAVRGSEQGGGREYVMSKRLGSTTYAASVSSGQTEHKQSSTLSEEPHASSSSAMTVSETDFPDSHSDTHTGVSSTAPTTKSADRPEDGGSPTMISAICSEDTLALEGHAPKDEQHPHHSVRRFPSFSRSRKTTSISSSESAQTITDTPGGGNTLSETQILLTGTSRGNAESLARSMKLAYGRYYSKADKRGFRVCILEKVVRDIRETLFSMADLGIALQNPGSERHAHEILTMPLTLTRERIALETIAAMHALWSDPGVVDAFHRNHNYDNHHDPD